MASPLEADDARRVADFEARLDPSDAAGAALLGEMKAELRRLQDARRHEDPRLSFSTPEFKEAQRAFTDAFKVHCIALHWLGFFWMQGAAEVLFGRGCACALVLRRRRRLLRALRRGDAQPCTRLTLLSSALLSFQQRRCTQHTAAAAAVAPPPSRSATLAARPSGRSSKR